METSELLENVLSSLGEQVVVLDRNGVITATNSGWDEAFRSNQGTAERCDVGANYLGVCRAVNGQDRVSAMRAVDAIEAVLSGRARERTIGYVCDLPSGPTEFLMTARCLSGPGGGVLVIHRRLTGPFRRDPEMLEHSVEKFRRMVDVVPALISYVDSDRRYGFVNRRYTDWFGHRPEDVVGKPLREVIGDSAYAAIQPDLARVFSGEEVTFERLLKYKDGGDRFVRGSFIPDVDESGAVRGYFALLLDSTERHRVEEELRHSEERFSKLFNFIPIAITISSLKEGRYIAVNETYLKSTGFDRENVIGRPTAALGIRMPDERVREFLENLAQDGSVSNFETELHFDDGRRETVLLNAVNLELGGEPHIAVAASTITELKEAERSLRELTGRLLNSQDAERRRIARELHDTTAQKISALLLSLSYLKKLIHEPRAEVSNTLAEAIEFAEESLGEIRTLSYVLHPPLLDKSGLRSAIRWFVDGFSRKSGIRVEVAFAGDEVRLPQEMEGAIFRIVQEALVNVHRHSGGSSAFILLEQNPDELVLEVRDEGRAILRANHDAEINELSDLERLGVGIAGMRERLRQFGGELNIDIAPEGTLVTARIPLNE
jgi:PAS domain S-box-containing protein